MLDQSADSPPSVKTLDASRRRARLGLPQLARRRALVYTSAAVLPIVVRLLMLPYWVMPEPAIHDEFAYLLGADTFASGRLANPTHPLWVHFETFQVNQLPTYASKYPPGQSLFLALGQWLFGHPWFGVLISVGLMCASMSWMLYGWLPPRYALLGTGMTLGQFGITGYWVNSYWGGAVAAAGGALVLGAMARLARRDSRIVLCAGAAGVVLLGLSRPYEGGCLVLAATLGLVWWRRRSGRPLRRLLAPRVSAPAALLLVAAVAWSGYYNYRVTGRPWLLPYVVHHHAYVEIPQFWAIPRTGSVTYRHEHIRRLWEGWFGGKYEAARANPLRVVAEFRDRVTALFMLPVQIAAAIAVLLVSSRRVRLALAIAAAVACGICLQVIVFAHYFAPAAGAVIVLAAVGIQHVVRSAQGMSRWSRAFALTAFFGFMLADFGLETWRTRGPLEGIAAERPEVINTLLRQGGRHLVLVRYAPDHDEHVEWVYNRADIDASAVVWAHDLGPEANRALLEYFHDRTVWLLEPDRPRTEPRLTRY